MTNKPASPPDEPTSPPPLFDNAMSSAVQQSAQQIWLAGMGAFAKAQEEGGRVFEALVREGTALQRKTHAAAEERIVEASGKIGDMADRVSSQAGQQWDRLGSIFEERVAKSLNRLGMPSVKDVRGLVGRVDELNARVAELTQRLAERESAAAPASTAPSVTPPAGAGAAASAVAIEPATSDRVEPAAAAILADESPATKIPAQAPSSNRRRARSA